MTSIQKQRGWYDSIKSVHCEYLDMDIVFNAKGFHHLFYNGAGKARTQKEIEYRMRLLALVIPVIKNAKEFSKRQMVGKSSRGKNAKIKTVEYWSLTAFVGNDKKVCVKVILRKVGNGTVHFWSVMKIKKCNKKHQPKS